MRSRMRMLAAPGMLAALLVAAPGAAADGADGPAKPRGAPVGPDFRISGILATAMGSQPAVAWSDSANEYLVVWTDQRNLATRLVDIAGQRASAGGSVLGSDFAVGGPAARGNESMPAAVWNQTADEYLVVWADQRRNATRGWDIYGQEVSWRGRLDGGNFRISGAAATSTERAPGIAYNGIINQYLVVWQDRCDPARDYDIWGRRVSG